ncbi:hypothetical protein GC176_07275 [bacterium]|nr:hypothetical protein [bacterium]
MMNAVFQRICEFGSSIDSPEGWEFLPPDDRLIVVDRSGHEILELLRGDFSDTDLVAAKVITDVTGVASQLNPALDASSLLVQKVMRGDRLIDLSTHRGSICSPSPPCFDISRDVETVRRTRLWQKNLFVVFCTSDLSVLRKLGLPVVGSAGLGSLSGKQLVELFGPRDGFDYGPVRHVRNSAPVFRCVERLVLVGWSVTGMTLHVSDTGREIIDALHAAIRAYCFLTDDVLVWQPSSRDISRFEVGRRARDTEMLCVSFRQSLKNSVRPIRYFVKHGAHLSHSLSSARERLRIELEKHGRSPSAFLTQAILEYREGLDSEIVKPIRDEAASPFVDPSKRPLFHLLADIVAQIHKNDPLLLEAGNGMSARSNGSSGNGVDEQCRLWDKAIAVYRELKSTR